MIVDIDNPSAADAVNLGDWSAAEFLDTSCAGSLTLRALVCRLGAGQWQWSIISYDGEHAAIEAPFPPGAPDRLRADVRSLT